MTRPIHIFSTVQKVCFLFFCSVLLSLPLFAIDSTQVVRYTVKDGLPTNNIYSSIISRKGYLWFATDAGIIRYNGYDFRVYNSSNAGLPDDDIYRIDEDEMGRIWLYTLTKSIGYLQNDHYTRLPVFDHYKEGTVYISDIIRLGRFTALNIASLKTIAFVGAQSDNVILFRSVDNTYSYFTHQGKIFFISARTVYMLDIHAGKFRFQKISVLPFNWLQQLNERLQLSIYDNGIAVGRGQGKTSNIFSIIDLYKNTTRLVDITDKINNERNYTSPAETQYPTVITNKHIYTFDFALNVTDIDTLDKPFFTHTQVSFKMPDSCNDQWYTTNSSGILHVLLHRQILKKAAYNIPENMRYIGKLSNKFSFWKDLREFYFYQLKSDGTVQKWSTNVDGNVHINSMSNWNDSAIVLAYKDNIALFNIYSGKRSAFFSSPGPVKVKDLKPGSIDTNTHTEAIISVTAPKKFYWTGMIASIKYADRKMVGCNSNGVYMFDFTRDSTLITQVYNQRYSKGFYSKKRDKIILYNPDEIALFNPGKNDPVIINVSRIPGVNKINTLSEDSCGNIYLLSENKLIVFNEPATKRQSLFTRFNLVRAKMDIYEDNLIIAGKFGVACAKISGEGKIGPFYIAGNNKMYENVNALWVNDRNNIILQTDNGYVQTNIDSVFAYGINQDKENTAKFSFAVNFPGQQALNENDTIRIDQKDQRLSIDAINFYGWGNVQYGYKINNRSWSQSATGELLLTSLKPDKYYKFQLTAKDDIWQSTTITAWIYVTPYWWQTSRWHTVFIVGGIIILILSILGIISIAREAVIKANEKKQKLTDLELRAIHSQINPHFIFNTLSTALYFITRKDFDNAYNHVNKFSRLLRSYLKSSHDRFVLLSEEIEMLKRYIELQQARFENRFEYKIYVENKVPAGDIQIPSLLLQPLVENAINHGLFHLKHKKGLLQIRFEQGKNATELICTIEDNGVGRNAAAAIKKESDAERQSYGSELTEKLVELFRQYEEMNILIEYRDKPEPEIGTVVKLVISNVRYIGFQT